MCYYCKEKEKKVILSSREEKASFLGKAILRGLHCRRRHFSPGAPGRSCPFHALPVLQPLTRTRRDGWKRRRPRTEAWGVGEEEGQQEGLDEVNEILALGIKGIFLLHQLDSQPRRGSLHSQILLGKDCPWRIPSSSPLSQPVFTTQTWRTGTPPGVTPMPRLAGVHWPSCVPSHPSGLCPSLEPSH